MAPTTAPPPATAAAKLLSVWRLAADCAVEAGTELVSARAPGALLCTPIDPNLAERGGETVVAGKV